MSHTPGVWVYGQMDDDGPWAVGTQDGTALAQMVAAPGPHNEANARLIAAAPDLLEASELFQKIIQEGCDDLPDDTGVVIKIGERVLDMSLTLADFRKLEAALVKAGAFS